MSQAEDLSWLDPPADGPVLVPTHGATKRELAAATGYSLKTIDKLCREGLPARSTGSKRGGLRFDLPIVVEWIADQRAADCGGVGDTYAEAKRKAMLAIAEKRQIEAKRLAGELIQMTEVHGLVNEVFSELRDGLLLLSSQLMMLSTEHRFELDRAVNGLLQTVSEKMSEEPSEIDFGEPRRREWNVT